MKYFLIILALVVIFTFYYTWSSSSLDKPMPVENVIVDDFVATTTETKVISSEESEYQIYRNNEWGITFSYPNDWMIRQPAFGSAVSLFNFSIEPTFEKRLPDPVLINITPKEWIVNALKKMEDRGITTKDVSVAGFNALKIEDQDMGIPSVSYLILINDSYWIDFSAKKDYEEILNQVLATLVITPVEIPTPN